MKQGEGARETMTKRTVSIEFSKIIVRAALIFYYLHMYLYSYKSTIVSCTFGRIIMGLRLLAPFRPLCIQKHR